MSYTKLGISYALPSVIGLLMSYSITFAAANANTKKVIKRRRLRIVYVNEEEERYLCSVTNKATGRTFFGSSPKLFYAKSYARTLCQMTSYKGQCFVKTNCSHGMMMVRKRKFVPVKKL